MKIKICGLTHQEDAHFAAEKGAWALGFNFYKDSPRYIDPQYARSLIMTLPASVQKVGICVDQDLGEILALKTQLALDYVQVYQDFNCDNDLKKSMILSIHPNTPAEIPSLSTLKEYAMVLIDAPTSQTGLLGGSGCPAKWEIAKTLTKEIKLILAGGLHPENIQEAIHAVQPFAIDLCSGIEAYPGKKDFSKLEKLFHEVKNDAAK